MRIPEIKMELIIIAGQLRHGVDVPDLAERLLELAHELDRRSLAGRSPPSSAKMSDEVRETIFSLRQRYPEITQSDIAQALDLNPGRVSEVLWGKRT